jgi:NADPH-dependent F420 reductase
MNEENCIGIIGGTGEQGMGLALRWTAAGRRVRLGSRMKVRAEEAAEKIRKMLDGAGELEAMTNDEVVASADTLLLAVPFQAQIGTLAGLRTLFRPGQLMVDCTVPLESAIGGSLTRLMSVWEGSAAQLAAKHVPEGVAVAAAFQNIPAYALQHPRDSVECDVLVCADARESRERVRPWVEAIPGCRYVDGGKLENARIMESITALLIGINRRYKVRGAGIRFTGLSEKNEP